MDRLERRLIKKYHEKGFVAIVEKTQNQKRRKVKLIPKDKK